MATALDVITDAFDELGVRGAADTLSAEDSELGLTRLNSLLDEWNADRQTVYREVITTGVLTADLSPHTIGPTGASFSAVSRPVSIDAANIVDTSPTPDIILSHLNIRDAAWYANLSVQAITSTIPSDLYYDPEWPNGNLYFWPVPTTAYTVQLFLRLLLDSDLALSDTFTMPPGYRKALTLTLAEDLAAPLNAQVKPSTVEAARKARARIFSNNTQVPPLRTQDAGMPRGGKSGYFNYMNGSVT